jgi:hypothetical protein
VQITTVRNPIMTLSGNVCSRTNAKQANVSSPERRLDRSHISDCIVPFTNQLVNAFARRQCRRRHAVAAAL